MLWPLPKHIPTDLGIVNGYEGNVILPIIVETKDPTQPVYALVEVNMLLCDASSCLPINETLVLDFPLKQKEVSQHGKLLSEAFDKLPKVESFGRRNFDNLQIQSIKILETKGQPPTLQVIIGKRAGTFLTSDIPELFAEIKGLLVDAPSTSLSSDGSSVIYTASIYPDISRVPAPLPPGTNSVTLTINYHDTSVEVEQKLDPTTSSLNFWAGMLLVAFLGGLILNIMPCVLPVLSLKVLSVLRHGGGRRLAVRQEFLATVLGIVFSFFLLACGAILLRASGHAVGWGIQFQEPYFLIALVSILTLFAANLFGFFEFHLPHFISHMAHLTPKRENLLGSFLEGSLVTLLATPCSAPFLGTALAFALSSGVPEIISIFSAMGLGLSFPFLLIAFFPSFATRFPKPGSWMVTVKTLLGFLIIATALWLLYVLKSEIGLLSALFVGLCMVAVTFILKGARTRSRKNRRRIWVTVSSFLVIAFVLPAFIPSFISNSNLPIKRNGLWQPFEPDKISDLVAQGKTVFVSVTADWCLTCKANYLFVLGSELIVKALDASNVVAMEADWTSRSSTIASYLKSFNQFGIPFYAVYGCHSPSGKFLGQILTPQKVLSALDQEKCPVSP